MPKSYVLKALKILGLEEILRLTTAMKVKSGLMKKAAGQELVSWDDAPEDKMSASQSEGEAHDFHVESSQDNILPFNRGRETPKDKPTPINNVEEGDSKINLLSSDFVLWQRELSKEVSGPLQTKEAVKGYSKSTEMYVVKTSTSDGKDKMRFASTQGVLINKKQA